MVSCGPILLLLVALGCSTVSGQLIYYSNVSTLGSYNVSYDKRSFHVNGKRTLFLSGSVHYPRSRPAMWDSIFQAMIDDGLNMVETYVFWNLHEPTRGQQFVLDGYANLTLFLEKAARAGLFVNLRIGPYVCAEWNWGGLPLWLRDIKGLAVRSSNALWQEEMTKYVMTITKLVSPYLAQNGGPIVLAQIENEYNWNDPAYVDWCGALVNGLKLGIPWLMCGGMSANNTINSCNGNDCATYADEHAKKFPEQPLVWTEDEGWFEEWDRAPNSSSFDNRSPQEMALAVSKWFARGGAHHNYYMWYGGNNYAQWAGSNVANKYANGANLHHDMLPNEPKKTHLRNLHRVLANYSSRMLRLPSQANHRLRVQVWDEKNQRYIDSKYQWIYLYMKVVVFLENEANHSASVLLGSYAYNIKARSMTIIDYGTMDVVYDSTDVKYGHLPIHRVYDSLVPKLEWKVWEENVVALDGAFVARSPLEQLNLTRANSDYLFYQTEVKVSKPGSVNVTINSTDANAFIAFIDGKMQSNAFNAVHRDNPSSVIYSLPVTISDTKEHNLTLLSVNLGVNSGAPPGSFDSKGIVYGVKLGGKDIWDSTWVHRPELEGEREEVYTDGGSANVVWVEDYSQYVNKPVVWFQSQFPRISVQSKHSIMLDLAGMGRGHIYLNGFSLGRYWTIKVGGVYVQRYYFIPPDLIMDFNLLTLVEECGASDPGSVSIVDSSLTKL